ncbi:MAG: DnaA regulatory inactivator Hda [Steroidobacteraceae bacterium]
MKQLPLGVRPHDRAVFASFLPGPNAEAFAAVRQFAGSPEPALLYLHGALGTGRSHLLQAACAAAAGAGYFPLGDMRALGPAVLEGVANLPLAALDDVDAVAGEGSWERQLFGLYNDCQASGCRLLVAASRPAAELPLALPDLRSRLAAMPHYALRPLDDQQQRAAIAVRAAQRGIELNDETLQYLQNRFTRDMMGLTALLDRLDLASLQEQRRVTLPFIRRVLDGP